MMKRFALTWLLVLIFALKLCAQNTGVQTYNVRTYGAKGDGTTDDTAAVTRAFAAAAAYEAANSGSRVDVILPRGTYMVAGSVGNPAVELTGSNISLRGEGMLKMVAGDDCDSVLEISGNYCQVEGITVDGNAAGTPTGRGECIRISGDYGTLIGVTAQNSKTTGGTGLDFMIFGANPVHNTLIRCTSINAGQAGFDDRGDYTTIRDCQAINFGVYGYTKGGGATEQVTIDGFYAESNSAAAHSGLILDPGGVDDYIVHHATVKNVRCQLIPNAVVYVKFARVHNLEISGLNIVQGASETVSSIKIVEACKSVSIKDSYFSRAIDFDEGAGVTGPYASVADNGSGYCRFTDTAHGLFAGDIIYIPDSSVAGYNGLHEVTATPTADTFDTNYRWTATATGNWYGATGQVILENVEVGSLEDSAAWRISGIRTPRFTAKNCRLIGCLTKAIAPKNSYPFTAVERYDIENCDMVFNRSSSDAYVLMGETNSTEYFTSSRKLRWVNNSYRNVLAGTVQTLYSTDGRLLATSSDGARDYMLSSGSLPSGSSVSWQVGDRFFKPAPAAGQSPGWVCTTAGTFDVGTFKPMPFLNDGVLVSNITDVGNNGGGEDNLITYSLPANTLTAAGESLEIEAGYSFAANGNTKTIKLFIGSADVLAIGGAAQNGGSYVAKVTVTRDTSSIGKLGVTGGTFSLSGTPLDNIPGRVYPNHSLDFTGTLTIKGTGESGSSASNDVVMEYLRVRVIPAP